MATSPSPCRSSLQSAIAAIDSKQHVYSTATKGTSCAVGSSSSAAGRGAFESFFSNSLDLSTELTATAWPDDARKSSRFVSASAALLSVKKIELAAKQQQEEEDRKLKDRVKQRAAERNQHAAAAAAAAVTAAASATKIALNWSENCSASRVCSLSVVNDVVVDMHGKDKMDDRICQNTRMGKRKSNAKSKNGFLGSKERPRTVVKKHQNYKRKV